MRVPFIDYSAKYLEQKRLEEEGEGMSDDEENIKLNHGGLQTIDDKNEPKQELTDCGKPINMKTAQFKFSNDNGVIESLQGETIKKELKIDSSDQNVKEENDIMEVEILETIKSPETPEASEDMNTQESEQDIQMEHIAIEA